MLETPGDQEEPEDQQSIDAASIAAVPPDSVCPARGAHLAPRAIEAVEAADAEFFTAVFFKAVFFKAVFFKAGWHSESAGRADALELLRRLSGADRS